MEEITTTSTITTTAETKDLEETHTKEIETNSTEKENTISIRNNQETAVLRKDFITIIMHLLATLTKLSIQICSMVKTVYTTDATVEK